MHLPYNHRVLHIVSSLLRRVPLDTRSILGVQSGMPQLRFAWRLKDPLDDDGQSRTSMLAVRISGVVPITFESEDEDDVGPSLTTSSFKNRFLHYIIVLALPPTSFSAIE